MILKLRVPQSIMQPIPAPLNYEPRDASTTRPTWIYAVLGVYLALLAGIVSAAGWFSLSLSPNDHPIRTAVVAFSSAITPFVVGGGLLILVPIRAKRGRKVTRRSIWLPLTGAGILLAILCLGAALAVTELLKAHNEPNPLAYMIFGMVGLIWTFWMLLFWWFSRSIDPLSLSDRLYKSLLAGSVVELLVAVPMHLVVRRRTECCAGMYTGTAICLGAVTAVVALGPGMFFLYHRRWKQSYRQRPASNNEVLGMHGE